MKKKKVPYQEQKARDIKRLKRQRIQITAHTLQDAAFMKQLATIHKTKFSIVKGFVRAELRRDRPMWRVELYDPSKGYTHHTTHYRYAYAMKAMKTAVRNNPFGWARIVDKSTGVIPYHCFVPGCEHSKEDPSTRQVFLQ